MLKIPQPAQLRNVHAGVLGLPGVVGRLADAALPDRLADLRAGFDFPEDPDNLFFTEFRLLRVELLSVGNSTSKWLESARTLQLELRS